MSDRFNNLREKLLSDRGVLLIMGLAGLVIIALLGLLIYRPLAGVVGVPTRLPPSPVPSQAPPTPTSIIHRGPIILKAIRSEAKLETYRMTLVNDHEVIRESGIGGICTERIVYLGYYDVTAGVDLAKITEDDITVVDTAAGLSVTITLPPAELVDVTLDTAESRLILQDTPKWIPGCETQVADMTIEAQQKIREYVTQAALEQGILQQAEEKAGFVLQQLLYDVGYPHVEVRPRGQE